MCDVWTLGSQLAHDGSNACYLKTCVDRVCKPNTQTCSGGYACTSGFGAPGSEKQCGNTLVPHMDSNGLALLDVALSGADATPEHCQALCCAHAQCGAFTFDTQNGGSTHHCWLKTSNGLAPSAACAKTSATNCTSGAVRATTPPPPTTQGEVEWTAISTDVVNSTAHQQVNYQTALQSFVLPWWRGGKWFGLGLAHTLTRSHAHVPESERGVGAPTAEHSTHNTPCVCLYGEGTFSWENRDPDLAPRIGLHCWDGRGQVLLKNEKQLLPLAKGKTIAVLGPSGVTQFGLLSDYHGDVICWSPGTWSNKAPKNYDCIPTIASQIQVKPDFLPIDFPRQSHRTKKR